MTQILVGRVGVADVELDRLADVDHLADGQRPRRLVGAEQIAYEKVAPLEVEPVLVDDEAKVQSLAHEPAIIVGRALHDLLEPRQRGLARELVHEVALGAGDRERLADRAAALRHDRAHGHVVGAHDRDRAARQRCRQPRGRKLDCVGGEDIGQRHGGGNAAFRQKSAEFLQGAINAFARRVLR